MRLLALAVATALAIGAFAGCSEAPDDYCDTQGVCTLPDGAIPDVKKDVNDGGTADATDATDATDQ
ncbi:hypothetical protein BH09MYX1_BH09MYX1_53510 [soil metagenome]